MRKKITMLFAVLCAFASSVMAQTYYKPGDRTTTLEAGKQYFISVATWYGSACTNLLYNNNGTLAKSDQLPSATIGDAAYLFTVDEVGDGKLYYIKNNQGKYLQADNLASTDTKTGVYVIQYFEGKAVCCGSDVDACDANGNKIAYSDITAETPIVTVQKNADYTNPDNRNGWRYIGGLSAKVDNWCTAFAFYEAVPVEVTNVLASEKVYRIVNKANAGKVIAENTDNFELRMLDNADNDNSQLWYVEGDDLSGYTFRNLKSADYMNFVDQYYTHWGTTEQPVPFYFAKVEEASGETPAYYAIALRNNATLQDLAYAHYSNGNVVRWQAKDGDNEVVNPSLWQFEEVSIDALATLDASYVEWKNEINPKISPANELLSTAGFSVEAVALTTENTTCPAAVADDSDGIGVQGLLDDKDDTYMHTLYSSKGSYGEHHYIQVDLGEDRSAKCITFSYRARHNNLQNNPETMIIKGSVDGEIYTDIQTLTNLPDGLIEYESPVVGNGTAYRYFRFVVTETTSNAKNGDYVFFALGKFRMNVLPINDAYVNKATVLFNMSEWLNGHEVSETRPADWCLKTVDNWDEEIDELIYGATLREYPFTLTTDVDAPVCYQILSGRANANNNTPFYFTLKPNDDGKVKLETSTKDNVYSYWFFMEEPATGKLMVVPFVEETKPLGYVTVQDGADKLTNIHTAENFAGYNFEVIDYADVDGFPYALKPYKANTNVSNHGGTNNFMGFYEGAKDGATAVKFEAVACPALEFRSLPAAIAAAKSNCPGSDRAGTMLNGYTVESVNAYKAAVIAADELYNDASTAAETINEHVNTLNNLYSVLVINLPEDGKFYRVRCSDGNKRLLSTLTAVKDKGDRLSMANTVTDESIFCYTGGALVSYQKGLSINAYNYNNVGAVSTVNFSKAVNKVLGCYNVKVGDRWIYGTGDYIDSGSGENPDNRNGYNWWLEEVTTLPVTVTSAGYATFYAPVEVTLPDGITAHTVTANGEWAILSEDIKVVPANNGVILKADEGSYDLTVSATDAEDLENALDGTVAKTLITKTEGDAYYVLAKKDENVGLYNPVNGENAATFYNAGFKAYWHIPAVAQSAGYRFGEGTTAIDNSQLIIDNSVVIYDLAGRRVEKMEKGIYIVNGKKVVIK